MNKQATLLAEITGRKYVAPTTVPTSTVNVDEDHRFRPGHHVRTDLRMEKFSAVGKRTFTPH